MDKITELFPNTFLPWCFTKESCLVSSHSEEQIKKEFNLKVILNLTKGIRNMKQMQTSDTTSFFQETF